MGSGSTNFHTTALCSPTRACLLTGRNHHRSGMGRVADLASGYPGYWGKPPRENGFLSEILRANGYATYAVGKWHLSPDDETNMAASRSTWPLGRGFDRWYGFHGGETHQFTPALYHDNHSVRPPASVEDGYHLSADLADRAIEFLGDLRAADADVPFFLYFCTGACHSPHQAPREWIDRYRGGSLRLGPLAGRDVLPPAGDRSRPPENTTLSPRPPWVPSWESLDERERALSERFMECFAAFLSYTDQQIGRVLDFIEDLGETDETLVIVVSDNGASSEGGKEGTINEGRLSNFEFAAVDEMYRRIDEIGGPLRHKNYPWGWTMAGNTPFKRWKREVHEGGVADPCISRATGGPALPAATAPPAIRARHRHLPTVLEIVGVDAPDEIDGIGSPCRRHELRLCPRTRQRRRTRPPSHPALRDVRIASDLPQRVEGRDLPPGRPPLRRRTAIQRAVRRRRVGALSRRGRRLRDPRPCGRVPDKVAELVELWWTEARRNDVLPLENRVLEVIAHGRPDRRENRQTFRYFQGGAPVPETVAANVRNRSHAIVVELEVPENVVANGTLLALGCALGGWSFHALEGRLRYIHNLQGQTLYEVVSEQILGPGRHQVEFRFDKDEVAGGHATCCRTESWWRRGPWTVHSERLQRGRHRAHLRLRMGPRGGRRLSGAVRVLRHDHPRRSRGHRTGRP